MAAPSESDGLRIEKLDKDYATWAILFQASLEDKELWTAIEDPQPDEMTDPAGAATWKKNRRAFGRLHRGFIIFFMAFGFIIYPSTAAPHSCFEPSKEMLYIPFDETSRNEGKAAIDVIGNPLGKSGGSFVQQVLTFATGSLAASTPYLAVILVGIIGMWLVAAKSLDKQFSAFMLKETAAAREKMKGTKAADEGPAAAAGASS